jgi:hypothetical protein
LSAAALSGVEKRFAHVAEHERGLVFFGFALGEGLFF